MRSQLLPRNLCLLIAFFLGFAVCFSAPKSLESPVKTTDNKSVNSKKVDSYYFNSPILSQKENASITKELSTDVQQLPNIVKKAENVIIEENSYNLMDENSAKIQVSKYNLASSQNSFKQGLFYGFALMVILLNIVCFFIFEDKVFSFYSLSLTFVLTSFMQSDGVFELIGINGIENTEAMQSTLLLIATAFGALFTSKYLLLEDHYPKLKWGTLSLLSVAFMTAFTGWLAETSILTSISNTISLSVMAIYFAAGIFLFSKKNYAKFYVIAYSIPLLFALDFFVFKKLGIDFLFTESFHLKAAAIVQMLIVSYAIMYRMKAIKEEHVIRQTEMRIFLKRQEVLNRSSTEKIMQDMYLENLIMHYDLDGFEIKLLQYISEGKDNVKIARKLKTTELEIEACTKELYNKLDIGEQIQEDYRMVETQPDYIYN